MDFTKDTLKQDWQETKSDVKDGLDTVAHKAKVAIQTSKDKATEKFHDAKKTFDRD